MDITEKKKSSDLDDNIKDIMDILKFKYDKLKIIGSSSLKSLKYFSDYDFKADIKYNYSDKEIYDEIKGILRNIFDNPNLYFVEMKIQNKEHKYKWFIGDTINYDDFIKKIKNMDYIKIDLLAYINFEFVTISVNYNFKYDKNKEDIIKKLNNDIKELIKEKRYFKILKRIYSISKINNDNNNVLYLTKIFNSDIGYKYKLLNVIGTLFDVIKYYKKEPQIKKKIEIVLSNYKLPQTDKLLKKEYEKLNSEVNMFGKNIYDKIKY